MKKVNVGVLGSIALLTCLFAFQNCGKLSSKAGDGEDISSSTDPNGTNPGQTTTTTTPSPTPSPAATPYVLKDMWSPFAAGTTPPVARYATSAVWTGSKMIVFGGRAASTYYSDGSAYDPATGAWKAISQVNGPGILNGHTAVWTGSKMIVFGGVRVNSSNGVGGSSIVNAGYAYDPATDSWSKISSVGAPTVRATHTAVWTGKKMIVWGGQGGADPKMTGGAYDPATDTWTPISTVNQPTPRLWSSAVWTGSKMIVWGGYDGDLQNHDNGIYDPETDTWTTLAIAPNFANRAGHVAVWTGSKMVVWGGYVATAGPISAAFSTGAAYDPVTDTWTPISTLGALAGRMYSVAVWTGTEMIIWGGDTAQAASLYGAGAIYF